MLARGGRTFCWGSHVHGQLGNGDPPNLQDYPVPGEVAWP